jgi:hypothetical protein
MEKVVVKVVDEEDILGPCGVRLDPEAHIPPVEYG